MGPIEIGVIAVAFLLLFGSRIFPKWGSALGETVGYVKEKTR